MATSAKFLVSFYDNPPASAALWKGVDDIVLPSFKTSDAGTKVVVRIDFAGSGWQDAVAGPTGCMLGYTLYVSTTDITHKGPITQAEKDGAIEKIHIGVYCNRRQEHETCIPRQFCMNNAKTNTTYYMKIEADVNTKTDYNDFFSVAVTELAP